MISLHLRGVSYAPASCPAILSDVDLDLVAPATPSATSAVGVVGANGAGKSTLLKLIAGLLAPSTGSVHVQSTVPPRFVPQDVDDLDDTVTAFATRFDGIAQRWQRRLELAGVDLMDNPVGHWSTLSPGIRKRWQVAAALADEPDVLLLDEPTNHLDAFSRQLIADAIARFGGLVLIVSHDRTLLDDHTDRTVRIDHGAAVLYSGNYQQARQRWEEQQQAHRDAQRQARNELARQQRILGDVRRDRHSAQAGARRERRQASMADSDAREAGRKFAERKAEAALAQRVRQMNTRVARAQDDADNLHTARQLGGELTLRHEPTGRRVLAHVQGDINHGGGDVLLHDVNVALHRGDRVRVAGPNGAGKSTLIAAIAAQLSATTETVGLLPQHTGDPSKLVRDVNRLVPELRGRVLGTLATLGVDPQRLLASTSPSPGETRKLALANLLAGAASVVMLDEPTNHLDVPSIERLEVVLADWQGALVLVTHDDTLASATTDVVWQVDNRQVRTFGAQRSPRADRSSP